MRDYTPPEGTVTVVSPSPISAKINGIPVELSPYAQIAIHPDNVPLAFSHTPAETAVDEDLTYQQRALKLAREAAIRHRDDHSYIGKNPDDFLPHQWVIDAVVMALKER